MNTAFEFEQMGLVLHQQQRAFSQDKLPSAAQRKQRLSQLKQMLLSYKAELLAAMQQDFSARSDQEMLLTEFTSTIQNINYLQKNLRKWMKPERRHVPLHLQPAKAKIVHQPLGVVGIMVPFNYPVFLSCSPLAMALAAGNRAMIKMSEATPATSALFAKLVAETFPEDLVTVINGEVEASVSFSRLPFDHLIFTGSGAVARHVMREASANLTPVTLELGGKSPVVIDNDFDIEDAAERICFGKSINAGQTCVAPDYVFVPREKLNAFITAYKQAFGRFFPTVSDNSDYSGIINPAQVQRLEGFLEDASARGATIHPVTDEQVSDGTRRFKLHLVTGVSTDMKLMQEEIFGPILPVLPYDDLDETIEFINANDRPLALYYFGFDRQHQQQMLQQTHSGGVCINEVMFHAIVDDMPFGGVGPSGMGNYHGKEGFQALSLAKPVLVKPKFNATKLLYPPYKGKLAKMLLSYLIR